MKTANAAHRKKPEQYLFRVEKGALVPNDDLTVERLRSRNYNTGDVLRATLAKSRNPKFHRLAHALGALIVENVEGFENLTAHHAIKRLQLEAKVACEQIAIMVPGFGMVAQFIPRSISFDSMDEGEFQETMRALSRHIAATYWRGMNEDEIMRMVEVMP
jgi:hypothetical protein